jgi:alcohol dehydrogenase class IV
VGETGVSPISAAAPLATILTMAGTGSEMDMGAAITVGDDHKKEVLMHPLVNPKFSILDPEYTCTVPEYHSMAGVADILCHIMEQYFTPDAIVKVQDRMKPEPRRKVSRSWKHSMVPSRCLPIFARQVSRKKTWKPSREKRSKEETWVF